MELKRLVCPDSPYVWDGSEFSDCFGDLVYGFGANLVTVVLICVLVFTRRNSGRISPITLGERVVLLLLPAFGAGMLFVDVVLLLRKETSGDPVEYHEWLFDVSELIVWITIIISSKNGCVKGLFCSRLLCFWWIVKALLGILHTNKRLISFEILNHLGNNCIVLLDIIYGISINVIRLKQTSSKTSSLEDALLSSNKDIKEGCSKEQGEGQSYWTSVTFKQITSVMNRGILKQLEFEDLLSIPNDMEPSSCHKTLLRCWRAQLDSSKSLFKAICYAYGWPYFRLGLLKVFNDCLNFGGPLLLNKLIRFLQGGSVDWDGYLLALSLGSISILKSFFDTQYTFHLAKLKLKMRSGIMTLIYEKCLCVTLAERSKFSDGEIQTFMSVDADRTVNLCNSFHDMWSLPLQIGVALYLLYTQVSFAFLSGLAITILLIPVNKWISEMIANATQKMMKQKDERIRRTGEILSHVQTLKMYNWENLFSSWVVETRSSEVKHLATRKYLDAWCVFFWATTPTLFSLFTFGLFALMGHELDAATVFTCLALFNNLISPLNSFPWVINGLIDAVISTRRLSRLLSCPEHNRKNEEDFGSPSTYRNTGFDCNAGDVAITMNDASCTWSSSDAELQHFGLNHATICIPRGKFVAIIGEVGSGKSSLLSAILREMNIVNGSAHCKGSVAYVPQVPWILSGTLRDNVLLGKDYDSRRFLDIVQACALDVDVSQMVGGDMAYIGEKGVNISGGQRARVALARAIYQDSDIYMLDDVLSAVDAQVARWILQNALLGRLMNQKTRVLCTHNDQAISAADMVIVMNKGHVEWVGSSVDVPVSLYSSFSPRNEFDAPSVGEKDISIDTSHHSSSNIIPRKDSVSGETHDTIEVEQRNEGRVELAVYKKYASFSGWPVTTVVCISAFLMQASRNGNDLWLSYWVDKTGDSQAENPMSFYLVVLCIFCSINSCLTLLRAFSFAFGGLQAAVEVHNTLLSKLVNAPVEFFNRTPSGRILNRLSSDLYTIDDSLPFILNILLANFVGLLGVAVILSYVQPVFLLLLFPFWFIYNKLQFFYRSTARELRRLDSISRSPIYSTFTETLDGSSTIRALQSEVYFLTKFTEHLTMYQRTSYSEVIASLWLSLRLQLLAAFVISFVAVMAVVGSKGYLPLSFGTPGLVGLALSYASPVVSLLGSFLTSFTETEKEMVSIERAMQYMAIPQEELGGNQSLDPDWPFHGLIEFQNVAMRYAPSLLPALRCMSFTIEGGRQVGIVGRTGAGKSSILNSLFRLAPIASGRILVDGLDIAEVPVRNLRAQLSVVPQSPFLFEGLLRDNLDPFQKCNDASIWNALEKCHIKEAVQATGGLHVLVKESGSSFSVGQRQLLCLARALLRSSKILCLDECTANVDSQTAAILQETISSECDGVTVITIAHRISTVMNMDSVLVLDRGTLVEQGNPQALLQDHLSVFSSFARASTMLLPDSKL